jgi:hydrogenase maturation factor
MPLTPGKLPLELLSKILSAHVSNLPDDVRIGPSPGMDAAVIKGDSGLTVVAMDPVTFVTRDLGYYLVTVNANDVAVMGARPKYFFFTLLLPDDKAEEADVDSVFGDVSESLKVYGAHLVGGHTEVTTGINHPIGIGTLIGETNPESLVTPGGARSGDALVMTKGVAIEGTSILAREKEGELLERLSREEWERMRGFHRDPGIGVVREALALSSLGIPTAMHDPTEGGLAMGAVELAIASGAGLHLLEREIPVYSETRKLCEIFGLNPLGLIASGTLLFTCPVERLEAAEKALLSLKIPMAVIGEMKERGFGFRLETQEGLRDLPHSSQDELTKVL